MFQLKAIVARHGRGIRRVVFHQRTYAGIRPHHIGGHDHFAEITAGQFAQITDFLGIDRDRVGVAVIVVVGGADQREFLFKRNREHDAAVRMLEDVRIRMVVQFLDDDMAALDQAHGLARRLMRGGLQKMAGPRTGCINQAARVDAGAVAVDATQRGAPPFALTLRRFAARMGKDLRALVSRVDRIQHDQTRIVDTGVRVDEAALESGLERLAGRMTAQVDSARSVQQISMRQVVIQEQPGANHPGRPLRLVDRRHEAHRPDDMGCGTKQDFALDQGLAHQSEFVVFEIAQPAVDQLGRGGGSMGRQIVLLAQHDGKAASGRIPRNADAVDSAADDQYIAIDLPRLFHLSRVLECEAK